MISTLDERHIARGYDPYNSADQPWVLQLVNYKREVKRLTTPTPAEMIRAYLRTNPTDTAIDAMMRRGFQHLASLGYEFFPPGERRKFP